MTKKKKFLAVLLLVLAASALWAAGSYKFPGDVILEDGDALSPQLRFKSTGTTSFRLYSDNVSLHLVTGQDAAQDTFKIGSTTDAISAILFGDLSIDPDQDGFSDFFTIGGGWNLDDQNPLNFYETNANGTNLKAFRAPASVSSDTTCTFEDDDHFIPFTCIGTGANPYDDSPDNDGEVPDDITVTRTKCINVDPSHSTTNWLFFRANASLTITGIDCIVDAATSVVMTLRECDSNGGSCGDTEAAITCLATNTTEASGIDDASVDAGDWMRITRGTMTGSPTQAELCVNYTSAS